MTKLTSIRLSPIAKKKLDEIVKQTGLSQTQVLEALLREVEAVEIVVRWHKQTEKKPRK